jgi:arylsulfatase A-like enzyme
MDIHEPYIPDRKFIDAINASIEIDAKEMFALYKNVLLKRDASDPRKVDILKKLYQAHVREADGYVEELFEIMRKLSVLDDTVVMITSDHGDEFGEHGSLSHDSTMYSELVNVPFMIYEPNRENKLFCDVNVSGVDVAPTIAKLFGIGPAAAWKGQALLPTTSYQERGVFGEAPEKKGDAPPEVIQEVHYYREGDLKIIYHEKGDSWELYDLAEDPQERNNIVSASKDTGRMKEKLTGRVRRAAK